MLPSNCLKNFAQKLLHMKRIKLTRFLPAGFIVLCLTYACKKGFLDVPPVGTLNPSIVANSQGVQGLLIGAYSSIDGEPGTSGGWGSAASNWTYGSVAADDAYKGSTPSDQGDINPLETWSATSTNGYVADKWHACYDGIQRANEVLRVMPLAKDITAADQATITAEARFIRGFQHFELKKVFNNVPYISETVTDSTAPGSVSNVSGSTYANIWPQIEADFTYAMQNLPPTQTQVGRANKWAAQAYLAKVYMFEKAYDKAKPLLDELIASGTTSDGLKYSLITFGSNFNPQLNHKGDAEAVFTAQTSVNEGSGNAQGAGLGTANGNYGDVLNFPYNGGPGACCGFFDPSQSLANAYKTDANGLPLIDESYNTGNNVSDPTTPYAGTLDPRIDWTMGRKGIPFVDWGPHPGDAWIRDPANNGHFNAKKNVYAQSQKGTYSSTENYWASTELVANNVNLIRFSDVLLWAAEANIQLGTEQDKALQYVNMVRVRAADPTGWVYKNATYDASKTMYSPQTTPADNYKISPYPAGSFSDPAYAMKAIMFERRLELALEGHRFFDLVRWGIADQVLNAYAQHEKTIIPVYQSAVFVKGKSEYFPIPQGQIDVLNGGGSVNLKQNPGY